MEEGVRRVKQSSSFLDGPGSSQWPREQREPTGRRSPEPMKGRSKRTLPFMDNARSSTSANKTGVFANDAALTENQPRLHAQTHPRLTCTGKRDSNHSGIL